MSNYNNYGSIALEAAAEGGNPEKSWVKSAKEIYKTESSQKKGCPKNAFLGLCEDGLVKSIKPGVYLKNSKSNLNKLYALTAVELLKENPNLTRKELWAHVKRQLSINKSHNSQMDVVIALFEKKMLVL